MLKGQVKMPACPGCGAEVFTDARFCSNCGLPLAASATPPRSQVPAAPFVVRRNLRGRLWIPLAGCGAVLVLGLLAALALLSSRNEPTARVPPIPTQGFATMEPTSQLSSTLAQPSATLEAGQPAATASPLRTPAPKVSATQGPANTPAPTPTQRARSTDERPFLIIVPRDDAVVKREVILVRGAGTPGVEITQEIPSGGNKHTTVNASGKWRMRIRLVQGLNQLRFRQEGRGATEQRVRVRLSAGPPERTPRATEAPKPRPTQNPRPAPTPTPPPAEGRASITSISVVPDPMRIDESATITARVSGPAVCGVTVYYTATDAEATADELQERRRPDGGTVDWTYNVGTSKAGSALITVTCGAASETARKTIR